MAFPFALAIPAIIEAAKKIIDRTVPDKAAAEKAKQELEATESKADIENALAQIAVNVEEAKSSNLLVSGWRPMCGWIGAFALGYAAILEPLARFVSLVFFDYKGPFPALDTTITMQILFGILGLGAYRTVEKVKKNGG